MDKLSEGDVYFAIRRTGRSATDAADTWIDDIDVSAPVEALQSAQVASAFGALTKLLSGMVDQMQSTSPAPKSVNIEVGLEVTGGGKWVVVHGDATAHITVEASWETK